jgi:hypothetical protein
LINLETKKKKILEDREAAWRLKSRALWLECGDENTKFFQAYARSRKLTNTIWSLKDSAGRDVKSFDGLSKPGKDHFQIFSKPMEGPLLLTSFSSPFSSQGLLMMKIMDSSSRRYFCKNIPLRGGQ